MHLVDKETVPSWGNHAGSVGRRPIVDVCEVVYDLPSWRGYLRAFAADAPSYLRIFARRLCEQADADLSRYRRVLDEDPFAAVDVLLEPERLDVDVRKQARILSEQGVIAQVVHGGMWETGDGTVNDHVAKLTAQVPELQFWAGLSLKDASAAMTELRRAHTDLDATGLSLIPFLDAVDVLDPRFAPIFEYAQREELPLWIHCGQNFAAARPIDSCTWRHIDGLAARYPGLVLVAGHGGWPWMSEMAAVAQRQRNVYLDSSTHRGSAMAGHGYGWEPVLSRADGVLRRKLLFGSTTWVNGISTQALAEEIATLGLAEPTVTAWLAGNAARLLGVRLPEEVPHV
ncbi:amidohydrolase family protein [Nocardia wallacei]|uniref:amidohydrolase family protein n=1 Tax=Nocardia wallacei TaxID=480035 RepID=UPI002458C510|nr:amidohydrolase family protein [Nocardia wallacei]